MSLISEGTRITVFVMPFPQTSPVPKSFTIKRSTIQVVPSSLHFLANQTHP